MDDADVDADEDVAGLDDADFDEDVDAEVNAGETISACCGASDVLISFDDELGVLAGSALSPKNAPGPKSQMLESQPDEAAGAFGSGGASSRVVGL